MSASMIPGIDQGSEPMFGQLGIGDVLAVHVAGIAGELVDIGAAIEGKPTPATHVVIVHHQDKLGRWWGIQGEPGGVGWVDMAQIWGSPYARFGNSNAKQERTPAQRQAVADLCEGLLHTGYDWVGGIVADGLDDVHLSELAGLVDKWWGWSGLVQSHGSTHVDTRAPGHVVCSSMPAWAHDRLGLAAPPGAAETVQPAEWWEFNARL